MKNLDHENLELAIWCIGFLHIATTYFHLPSYEVCDSLQLIATCACRASYSLEILQYITKVSYGSCIPLYTFEKLQTPYFKLKDPPLC